MHVWKQDEADLPAVDFPHLHLRIAEHLHVAVPAVVVQRGGPHGPSRLVMVPREDPHLDARAAQGLDDVPPDHLPEHRGHMGAVEQVAEDAEQGGAVFDRPASGLREVAVEVERAFRDARFRIDPEVETQALVDIAYADDLVHPGVRKATWLLIMSTRRSAKVSNDAARTLPGPPPLPGGGRCIGAEQVPLDETRSAKRHKRLGPLFRRHVLREEATRP